jgi:hypothetical protein
MEFEGGRGIRGGRGEGGEGGGGAGGGERGGEGVGGRGGRRERGGGRQEGGGVGEVGGEGGRGGIQRGVGAEEKSIAAVAKRGPKEVKQKRERYREGARQVENFNVDDDAFELNTSTPTGIMGAIGGSGANLNFNRTFPLPTPCVRLAPLEQTRRKVGDHSVIPPISTRPHTSQAKSSTAAAAKKKDTRRHHLESEVSPPSLNRMPEVAGIFDEEIEEFKDVYTAALQTLGSDVFHQAINLARLFPQGEVKVSRVR